jgi:hypothetical protein
MFTESIAHRDQSRSPREPSSSRMRRCSFAQTRAALHSVKRRCAVGPEGPKTGGNCRQVQPVVATKMIAASTSRSPYRRRPPPCGRDGAGGTTRSNSSHNSSGTMRSTITTRADYPAPQMRRRLRKNGVATLAICKERIRRGGTAVERRPTARRSGRSSLPRSHRRGRVRRLPLCSMHVNPRPPRARTTWPLSDPAWVS